MKEKDIMRFRMFSRQGDIMVTKKVNKLLKKGLKPEDGYDFPFFEKHFSKISKHKYGAEVFDTVVRDTIAFKLNGWDFRNPPKN